MSQDLHSMFQEALAANESGNPQKARDLLSKLVELDDENVEAWIELSKVVDNEDERRICLTTVLQLEPNNSYARRELAKSEAKVDLSKSEEEVAPGITRRMVRVAAIGSALYILVVCSITFLITSGVNSSKAATRAQFTKEALSPIETNAALSTENAIVAMTQTMESITATAQAQALITPSATNTRTPDPAFATWTPTAEATTVTLRVADPPPPDTPGKLIIWGGRDATNSGFLDMYSILPSRPSEKQQITTELAQFPAIDVPGQRIVFEQFNRRLSEFTIMTLLTSDPVNTRKGLNEFWQGQVDLVETKHPSLSADGQVLVFDALARDTNTRQVFMIKFATNEFVRITNDGANYSYPAISLDATKIAVVRDSGSGPDLVLIDVETLTPTQLTNDGGAQVESHPSWHRDGLQFVYAAHPAGQDNNNEIYLLRLLNNTSSSTLLIATADDEKIPVFGPMGRFVAFASNRGSGIYNIYLFDLQSVATYQVTAEQFNHFPGGWSQ